MKLKMTLLAALLPFCLLTQGEALAANTICRAASQGLYSNAIRRAIASQLTSAGVPYSAIYVAITADSRRASIVPFTYDASSQVSVTANPLGVVFNGELPAPANCAIPGTLRIAVRNGNVLVLQKSQPITIEGVQAAGGR